MKTTQSSGTRPDHQTVAGTFEFKANGKAIAIGFTDQQLSPHAGSALFWAWLHPLDWCQRWRRRCRIRCRSPITSCCHWKRLWPSCTDSCVTRANSPYPICATRSFPNCSGSSVASQSVLTRFLSGVHFGGRHPALLSSVLVLGPAPAAQPAGRLHSGFRFHAAAA